MPRDVHRVVQGGHGFTRLRTGRTNRGRVLASDFGLIVYRIVGVAAHGAQRGTDPFQTVRPAHNGRHGPAVQRLGQRISDGIGLKNGISTVIFKRLVAGRGRRIKKNRQKWSTRHVRVTVGLYQLAAPMAGRLRMRSGGDAPEQ